LQLHPSQKKKKKAPSSSKSNSEHIAITLSGGLLSSPPPFRLDLAGVSQCSSMAARWDSPSYYSGDCVLLSDDFLSNPARQAS
jgi:hypothetical protein